MQVSKEVIEKKWIRLYLSFKKDYLYDGYSLEMAQRYAALHACSMTEGLRHVWPAPSKFIQNIVDPYNVDETFGFSG